MEHKFLIKWPKTKDEKEVIIFENSKFFLFQN